MTSTMLKIVGFGNGGEGENEYKGNKEREGYVAGFEGDHGWFRLREDRRTVLEKRSGDKLTESGNQSFLSQT